MLIIQNLLEKLSTNTQLHTLVNRAGNPNIDFSKNTAVIELTL